MIAYWEINIQLCPFELVLLKFELCLYQGIGIFKISTCPAFKGYIENKKSAFQMSTFPTLHPKPLIRQIE